MRHIARPAIDAATGKTLSTKQKAVDAAKVPAAQAVLSWKTKTRSRAGRQAFDAIRAALTAMASGRRRCMYCEDSLGTDIDHFWPKSIYPGKTFDWMNYLLACTHCNSNEKRTHFPLDSANLPLLIDPSTTDPVQHLVFIPDTGYFVPVTKLGEETEAVFGLNRREELVSGRADTWRNLERIVDGVQKALARKDRASVLRLIAEAKRLSFQSVVHHFINDALSALPAFVSSARCPAIQATKKDWAWAI